MRVFVVSFFFMIDRDLARTLRLFPWGRKIRPQPPHERHSMHTLSLNLPIPAGTSLADRIAIAGHLAAMRTLFLDNGCDDEHAAQFDAAINAIFSDMIDTIFTIFSDLDK